MRSRTQEYYLSISVFRDHVFSTPTILVYSHAFNVCTIMLDNFFVLKRRMISLIEQRCPISFVLAWRNCDKILYRVLEYCMKFYWRAIRRGKFHTSFFCDRNAFKIIVHSFIWFLLYIARARVYEILILHHCFFCNNTLDTTGLARRVLFSQRCCSDNCVTKRLNHDIPNNCSYNREPITFVTSTVSEAQLTNYHLPSSL